MEWRLIAIFSPKRELPVFLGFSLVDLLGRGQFNLGEVTIGFRSRARAINLMEVIRG